MPRVRMGTAGRHGPCTRARQQLARVVGRLRNYRDALKSYYSDRQNRMAERLNLSKGWLSKMLTVAALPDWAVAAYASPADIQLKVCYQLASGSPASRRMTRRR